MKYTQSSKYWTKKEPFGFFHDRPIWRISVRLSDRSSYTEQKKFHQKIAPQWGLNPWPPDHHSHALPTELGSNMLGMRFLKWALFVSYTTSHVGLCLFLESTEHDFIKTLMIHTDNKIVNRLMWQRIRVIIQRSWVQTPLRAIFDNI